ncbi:MAG: ribulose-phosphate 3-epimerase [Erysipelotrichaceae bacterium]
MKKLLFASMMCADFGNLKNELNALEKAGIDVLHLDVMDGSFVPNFGLGLQMIKYICDNTSLVCDVHLMVENPALHIDKFIDVGVKIIYIHPEVDRNACRTLQRIKDRGVKTGIAINPQTSFESVKELLYLCDYVMIMSVNPGFAGQEYLSFVNKKFERFIQEAPAYDDYQVVIDGACSPKKIAALSKIGVKGFVLGTSALFGKEKDYQTICSELRKL